MGLNPLNQREGRLWNIFGEAHDKDDVAFIESLIIKFAEDYNIDFSRVYTTGFSAGGNMSFYLGCTLSDRIAAVSSVGGGILKTQIDLCIPSRPIPMLEIHGTNDELILYNGNQNWLFAVPEMMKQLAIKNGCDTLKLESVDLPDIADDAVHVIKHEYFDCADNVIVSYYEVVGGFHNWPGGNTEIWPTNIFDINASEVIWDFVSQFKHPNPKAVN